MTENDLVLESSRLHNLLTSEELRIGLGLFILQIRLEIGWMNFSRLDLYEAKDSTLRALIFISFHSEMNYGGDGGRGGGAGWGEGRI